MLFGSIGTILILAVIYLLIISFWRAVQTIKTRGFSPKVLTYRFKQKIMMTAGLGFFFACLYLLVLIISPYIFNKNTILLFLSFGRDHPITLLYIVLTIFIANSILICFVRNMLISLFSKFK